MHGDIARVAAPVLFSCIVSIFASGPEGILPEAKPQNVHLHTDARVFARRILNDIEKGLQRRRPPQELWHKLHAIAELMIRWFFPCHLLGHRVSAPLEFVLSVVFAAKGLIWLRTRNWTEQAKRVCKLLPQAEADAILFGCGSDPDKCLHLHSLIERQRLLIEGPSMLFGLYQWWSECWRYVGIGKLLRKTHPAQGGLSKRFMEHLLGTMRGSYRDGQKLRYRLARRTLPWSSFFLVCATGTESYIRACELVDLWSARCISPAAMVPQRIWEGRADALERDL